MNRQRVTGIDVVRGVVMVLMAIDHVRLYGGVPAGGPDPAVFFTRWVTHFCAPAFVFFAGTSAFLSARADASRSLSTFLFVRGLLLVGLELTVVKFSWGFNLDYASFTLAGVIWMLGWCMVIMSMLVRLTSATVLGFAGLGIVVFQPLFAWPAQWIPSLAPFWAFIYPTGADAAGGIQVLYTIVPWIGVMAAGYGFGMIATMDEAKRRRWCLRLGLGAIALFLLIAIPTALMRQQPPNGGPPLLLRVLNQSKYPASLAFLLMTLGPAIALLPLADRASGKIGRFFETFGRVPMFYYLLHIPAIHLAALATAWLRGDGIHHEWYRTAPYAQVPPFAQWTLWELYLVFAIVVMALYFPCRWYARRKLQYL